MTLVEFVEARIADDERFFAHPRIHGYHCDPPDDCTCTGDLGWRLRRGLRECEAYRAILAMSISLYASSSVGEDDFYGDAYSAAAEHAISALARIWRDHPDYDPDWE